VLPVSTTRGDKSHASWTVKEKKIMISQLFALPLRALIIAAVLPMPPALGAAIAGHNGPSAAVIGSAVPGQSISLPAFDPSIR
jgi:hypothetical protein